MSIEKHIRKQIVLKGLQHDKMEPQNITHLVETHKTARNRQKTASYQSSLCHLNNAEMLMYHASSNSAEIPSNNFSSDEMLGAVFNQNDDIHMQQVQLRAKAFADQLLGGRKYIVERGMSSEDKSFFDVLQVIGKNKDLVMEFLPGPNLKIARFVKPVLDAKFLEYESKDATSSEKGSSKNRNKPDKMDPKCQDSSKTSFVACPHKKEMPKQASQIVKYSDSVTCHCSFTHSSKKSSGTTPGAKPASFYIKEMKKKLMSTFRGSRKEPNNFSIMGTSHKLAQKRSILKVGDCIFRGVDTKSSFSSSTNAKTRQKLFQKPSFKSSRGPDIVCIADTVRRKVDFPSLSLSKKQEFDVIFGARRQISARVKNQCEVESSTYRRPSKTLERLLSSPEHNFWPISPRGNSQCAPGPTPMRFSICCKSPTSSPLGQNKVVTSGDDYKIGDGTNEILKMQISPSIQSTDYQALGTVVYATEYMNSYGEFKIEEMNYIQQHELYTSEVREIDVADVTKSKKKNDTLLQNKENVFHRVESVSDPFPLRPLYNFEGLHWRSFLPPFLLKIM